MPFYLLGATATGVLVIQFGFGWTAFGPVTLAQVRLGFLYGFVAFNILAAIFISPKTILARSGLLDIILCFAAIWTFVEPTTSIPQTKVILFAELYAFLAVLYALSSFLLNPSLVVSRWGELKLKRSQLVVCSFLAIIAFGALGLSLPRATVSGEGLGFINTLFTATSAVCVTGLTVINLSRDLTPLGQGILLSLIQIGGLGLMTFTAFFSMVLGRDISLKGELVLRDALDSQTLSRTSSLIIGILSITIIAEGTGAALLYLFWPGKFSSPAQGIFWSVFHAISAFCNAGFSLLATNDFSSYRGAIGVNYTMMSLIVVGGLGFIVIQNLIQVSPLRLGAGNRRPRLMVHTKIVLTLTALLVSGGAMLFFLLERNGSMAGYTFGEKVTASLFQAITARTAGFNTVNIGVLANPAIFLLMLLMFVGASPGSTGGGVKTSTIGVLLGTVKSILNGRTNTELFGRTIPQDQVNRSLTVIFISFAVISVSAFSLMLVELRPFSDVLFETISAFGTVGLSRGITPALSTTGKIILMITMIAGRIGPLTLALAIGERVARGEYEYPQEYVMLG